MEPKQAIVWTFTKETEPPKDFESSLTAGEEVVTSYKTVKDIAVITNKRIIVTDRQGVRGRKMETHTVPFKSIKMYTSTRLGKKMDSNSDITIWTEVGHFKITVKKGVDSLKIDSIIAEYIL